MKLVSCIMPTADSFRREWALHAIDSFHSQTYARKELIILDDADNPTFDQPPAGVTYSTGTSDSIGSLRNTCCWLTTGDVIAHWDSDDWSAPERLEIQIHELERERKAVTGFYSMLFYDVESDSAFAYSRNQADYALGTSLVYLKSWWQNHKFDRINVGEDLRFVNTARSQDQFIARDGGKLMVARVHSQNTSPKRTERYRRVELSVLPEQFGGMHAHIGSH